jgi:phosphodiesterase/alkaline phosphatase D-like protein
MLCLLAVPLVAFTTGARPAAAANVTNTTIHVPASVQTNPCFPTDVVNLSGDIHVVIASTGSKNGGYHMADQLNSQLSGVSITTGTKYVNDENQGDTWTAVPPFPVIHTHTYDFLLLSQSNTPNYVLHMTMHTTVTANGVPTATVDNWYMDCQG